MRISEDREAHVPVRHGKVIKRLFIGIIRQLGMRRVLVVFLRGVQVKRFERFERFEGFEWLKASTAL